VKLGDALSAAESKLVRRTITSGGRLQEDCLVLTCKQEQATWDLAFAALPLSRVCGCIEKGDDLTVVEACIVEVVWKVFLREKAEEALRLEKKSRKKNLVLLSFGEEAEKEEQELEVVGQAAKIRSAHDVIEDSRSAPSIFMSPKSLLC
jgi:hypothetical protein